MDTLSGDNPIWEDFLINNNIKSEEEDEFLEYLFEMDHDPDLMSLRQLNDAYVDFGAEGNK